jgi:hypothetical protein
MVEEWVRTDYRSFLRQLGAETTDATTDRTEHLHDRNMVGHLTGNAQSIYGSVAHAAAMQQMLQVFPDMHVNTPYPIQFGKGDWITGLSLLVQRLNDTIDVSAEQLQALKGHVPTAMVLFTLALVTLGALLVTVDFGPLERQLQSMQGPR